MDSDGFTAWGRLRSGREARFSPRNLRKTVRAKLPTLVSEYAGSLWSGTCVSVSGKAN
jgi:hypothetical protein